MKALLLTPMLVFILNTNACNSNQQLKTKEVATAYSEIQGHRKAYFASGCFWCVEAIFESVNGVDEVISGYCGGEAKDAHYELVGYGGTGHAESVEVHYDPSIIDYNTLLKVFFGSHDATTRNRQGPDAGTQYRSAIFYQDEAEKIAAEKFIEKLNIDGGLPQGTITTEVSKLKAFYPAEGYHQNYEKLHPDEPYVRGVSIPRLKKFQNAFPELLKQNGAKH